MGPVDTDHLVFAIYEEEDLLVVLIREPDMDKPTKINERLEFFLKDDPSQDFNEIAPKTVDELPDSLGERKEILQAITWSINQLPKLNDFTGVKLPMGRFDRSEIDILYPRKTMRDVFTYLMQQANGEEPETDFERDVH